ncbi:hypothetical protein MAMC_00612 [Methylacidimicrobium cyclopophantes]|uniref:Uncharacterized protein n=1 Tax=Methylacidimicrobium cyclopophantes TaxID=1041766 RepID=A0A5E6M7H4_9BACT|nr:hypothetical protein [Methylacidimicrobium cyclopophantes]VVM05480.1 hypothetical protein MAMC_00612 [Methylacidimicrobium cyclopophantes]
MTNRSHGMVGFQPAYSFANLRERRETKEGLPVTRSVVLANQKDTFLGLEGPLIFVPALAFITLHKITKNFFLCLIAFIVIYLFLRIYLSDKPKDFLKLMADYQQFPKRYEHRFHNVTAPFDPATLFSEHDS